MTLVYDISNRTVDYIAEGRGQEALTGFYTSLSSAQLAGILAVAMDMWSPYVNATLASGPDAETKIVFDRFHMNKAVDKVRRDDEGDRVCRATLRLQEVRLQPPQLSDSPESHAPPSSRGSPARAPAPPATAPAAHRAAAWVHLRPLGHDAPFNLLTVDGDGRVALQR